MGSRTGVRRTSIAETRARRAAQRGRRAQVVATALPGKQRDVVPAPTPRVLLVSANYPLRGGSGSARPSPPSDACSRLLGHAPCRPRREHTQRARPEVRRREAEGGRQGDLREDALLREGEEGTNRRQF